MSISCLEMNGSGLDPGISGASTQRISVALDVMSLSRWLRFADREAASVFYIQYFFVFLFLTAISLLVSRVPSCIWANAGYSPEWIARLSILWLICSLWPVNNRYKWRFIIIYLQEYSEKYKCSFWNLKWFNINRTIIYCTIYDYKYDLTVECYSYVSSGQVQVLHVYEYSRVISLVSKMYRLELSWLLIVV